jgi:uncharacterized protein (DUF697 family)
MPTALQLAAGDPALVERVQLCRRFLHRRALAGAAAGAVPIPGLDFAVDAAVLSRLLPEINSQFGLTPDQLARLPRHQHDQVQKAISVVGSVVIGKVVTREVVIRLVRTIGIRMTGKQAARYVPFAGQAVAALMGYAALRYLGEEHLKDCVRVVRDARLALPPAPLSMVERLS